jgi:beta-glucoside PTS system EIICBA component
MKYKKLAKAIIENVGGKENVNSVVHCITRLRFKLKDEGKANTQVLEKMDGVVTVRQSGGQYQVVIGNHVPDVYKAVVAEGGFELNRPVDDPDDNSDKGSLLDRFIDMISGIFQPILAVLVASGMIKGFNALFIAAGWLNEASGTYQVLNAIGDALFYFLPIFLGYTAMKKFGGTPFLGMLIAGALVYPALDPSAQAGEPLYTLFAGTLFESPVHIEFFGIPIILMTYAMSVIPIIFSTFFAAKLENFFCENSTRRCKNIYRPDADRTYHCSINLYCHWSNCYMGKSVARSRNHLVI